MFSTAEKRIARLLELKEYFNGQEFKELIHRGFLENSWFEPSQTQFAIDSIVENFLDREQIEKWLRQYNFDNITKKNVGIIAAGNIPMVSFFDVLSVFISGHTPVLKLSSKDSVMMHGVADFLGIESSTQLFLPDEIDALIATGSSETASIIRQKFSTTPSIIRGTKRSFAILTNRTTTDEIKLLSSDLFQYGSLGCRSVTHLFLSSGFDIQGRLIPLLNATESAPRNYTDSARLQKALYAMKGEKFISGEGFALRETLSLVPCPIGVVGYSFYDDITEFTQGWLNELDVQCIVSGEVVDGVAVVPFGDSQNPTLYDFADSIDTMQFLSSL